MTTTYNMNRYNTELTSSVFRNEDKAKAKNVFASRSLQNDLDRERGIEKMHLDTIRREQVMLQKELEKVRTKGQYLNGNRPIVRSQHRLRHVRYTHERRKPRDTEEPDPATGLDSTFPSINGASKQFIPKSTPLQREYEQKIQNIQKESNREQTISQRRLKEMSRKQERLVARVADLAEGMKKATTFGTEGTPPYKGIQYTDGKPQRKMSKQEKISSNLQSLPSIFSLPIPSKSSLSLSPNPSGRLDASPLQQESNQSPTSPVDVSESSRQLTENTQTITSSEQQRAIMDESKRVADIIANPTLWFDQDKYAPDGGLRTIHILPDSDDSFHEAKKARYLRWKDPQKMDRELSVTEVFTNSKKKTRRQSKMLAMSNTVPTVNNK